MRTRFFRLGLPFACLWFFSCCFAAAVMGADYYLDPAGDDAKDGETLQTAWKTLKRLNTAELLGGDTVRFKAGGLWRGSIKPRSGEEGEPITYTVYGEGAKPRIYGSAELKDCWEPAGKNLWQTPVDKTTLSGPAEDFLGGNFWIHTEGGAKAKLSGKKPYSLQIEHGGTQRNHLQWINAPFAIREGETYAMVLTVDSDKPFTLDRNRFSLMKAGAPYTGYGEVVSYNCKEEKTDGKTHKKIYTVLFTANRAADDARVTVSFGGAVSENTMMTLVPEARLGKVESLGLNVDVGNLIFDGSAAGWKRWGRDELKSQGDFYYDPKTAQVVLYSEKHPDEVYGSVEAALKRHIVDMSNTSWCVFDGLDFRYGSAHGFGGTKSAHYIIRNCDLSWIGGAHQHDRADGKPVRYGNAIEFWADARDHLVENNRIWEVYDAALTNQGSGVNIEKNIIYRDNEVWNCEYSYEYWNRGPESITDNVLVEKNVFRDAGYGWGHVQRPDPNGRHIMIYQNSAKTTALRIVDNVFDRATESCVRVDLPRDQITPGWTTELELDRNRYIQEDGKPAVRWNNVDYDFESFRKATGKERNGSFQTK